MKTYLITGGCGFIGSNFIRLLLDSGGELRIVNMDALTYAGNPDNLSDIEKDPRYAFIHADIRDEDTVYSAFETHDIDYVVHFAAESHVDRSISGPGIFAQTNVLGTVNLLEAARRHWREGSSFQAGKKFVQISTDEVYGTLPTTGSFRESMPLAPNSPYSASKAGADLMVRAYHETFGLPVNITRCSNNYGPFQFPEKLIPLMIHNCKKDLPLPVYGDGKQVRDWIHVYDHCLAILAVLKCGRDGEVYNIGGNSEKTNIEVVKLIINALGRSEELIHHVEDRLGHDRRYAINTTKIKAELGWSPKYEFEQGIMETIRWYTQNEVWLRKAARGQSRHK